jgi:hypothetical protein
VMDALLTLAHSLLLAHVLFGVAGVVTVLR